MSFQSSAPPAAAAGTLAINTITGDTTISDSYDVIRANVTTAAITVTLHAVATAKKKPYYIIKVGTGTSAVTVDANSSETIDGATTYVLKAPNEAVTIIPDGTEWNAYA